MNRLIIVTGASKGIGKSIVKRFAEDGDKVLMISRKEDNLIQAKKSIQEDLNNVHLDYIASDVSNPASLPLIKDKIESMNMPIHAIICCAGAAPDAADGDISSIQQEWVQAYESNVMTTVFTIEGLESYLANDSSVIIFSSIAAYRGSGGSGAYGAMKSALHSYAHTLALRMGPKGINVNVIAPGYISDTDFFGDRLPEMRRQTLIHQTTMGRPGQPDDCAGLCFYLCSNEGAYITSQILQINGGSNHGV